MIHNIVNSFIIILFVYFQMYISIHVNVSYGYLFRIAIILTFFKPIPHPDIQTALAYHIFYIIFLSLHGYSVHPILITFCIDITHIYFFLCWRFLRIRNILWISLKNLIYQEKSYKFLKVLRKHIHAYLRSCIED